MKDKTGNSETTGCNLGVKADIICSYGLECTFSALNFHYTLEFLSACLSIIISSHCLLGQRKLEPLLY